VDHYTHPEIGVDAARRVPRAAVAVTALVGALVALSIAGSALWRPSPLPDTALELGRAELVSFGDAGPNETIPRVVEYVFPAVGFLVIDTDADDPRVQRSGSGVVVHETGFMITNAHVVEDASRVTVSFANGAEYQAEVYGVHPQTDLAVVKIETDEPLPVAALGDSDALRVGEFVLALGAPFGFQESATSGIVSGLHRNGLGIARYEDFIVTDAPINPGNSGGPLVNLRGEVVGINTAIIACDENHPGRGTFAGVGFAIPVNVARVVARNLIGDGGLGAADPADFLRVDAVVDTDSEQGNEAGRTSSGSTLSEQRTEGPSAAVAQVRAFGADGRQLNVGSGFIIDHGGVQLLITNAHVVGGAVRVEVALQGRGALAGEVIHSDQTVDVAVVRLQTDDVLSSLELGTSSTLAVQDRIVAIGARDGRIAEGEGVVTRLGDAGFGTVAEGRIETSAPTEPGDSGGPLLGADGVVVGVLVARDEAAPTDTERRRSYAIPIDEVVEVLQEAAASDDQVDLGFVGFAGSGNGVIALSVDPDGAAARAGLENGDIIIAADGESLAGGATQDAWLAALSAMPAGSEVTLTVRRRAGGSTTDSAILTIVYTVPGRLP